MHMHGAGPFIGAAQGVMHAGRGEQLAFAGLDIGILQLQPERSVLEAAQGLPELSQVKLLD